jgi:hypothetical protein
MMNEATNLLISKLNLSPSENSFYCLISSYLSIEIYLVQIIKSLNLFQKINYPEEAYSNKRYILIRDINL